MRSKRRYHQRLALISLWNFALPAIRAGLAPAGGRGQRPSRLVVKNGGQKLVEAGRFEPQSDRQISQGQVFEPSQRKMTIGSQRPGLGVAPSSPTKLVQSVNENSLSRHLKNQWRAPPLRGFPSIFFPAEPPARPLSAPTSVRGRVEPQSHADQGQSLVHHKVGREKTHRPGAATGLEITRAR